VVGRLQNGRVVRDIMVKEDLMRTDTCVTLCIGSETYPHAVMLQELRSNKYEWLQ
jgi:hypothetical protein